MLLALGLGVGVRAHRACLARARARVERAERLRALAEIGREDAERRLSAVSELYEAASRRNASLAPGMAGMAGMVGWPAPSSSPLAALTPRELEVVTLIAGGLTNEEIAGRLFLAKVTVKTHANRAMTKLGVGDRAQLVVVAYETGLVCPGRLWGL